MTNEREELNAHQADVRRRADSLAKSIFVLAGGTLTVSIGIFTRESAPLLSPDLTVALKASWGMLFTSIIFLVMTLTTIIARDYAFGEKWRQRLNGQNTADLSGSSTTVEVLIWTLALLGLFGFVAGIIGQAIVASSAL